MSLKISHNITFVREYIVVGICSREPIRFVHSMHNFIDDDECLCARAHISRSYILLLVYYHNAHNGSVPLPPTSRHLWVSAYRTSFLSVPVLRELLARSLRAFRIYNFIDNFCFSLLMKLVNSFMEQALVQVKSRNNTFIIYL